MGVAGEAEVVEGVRASDQGKGEEEKQIQREGAGHRRYLSSRCGGRVPWGAKPSQGLGEGLFVRLVNAGFHGRGFVGSSSMMVLFGTG